MSSPLSQLGKRMIKQLQVGRRRARLFFDGVMDWRMNVDTRSGAWTAIPRAGDPGHETWVAEGLRRYLPSDTSRFNDSYPNIPVSWMALRTFVDRTRLRPHDVFYDIGCGSGRVLCFVAGTRLMKCVGVELSADFAAKAGANARSLRGRVSPIEIRVGDAAEMDYTDGTVFFLFNPFGRETLQNVLERIRETLSGHPRPVRFIYVSPVHRAAFESSGWLEFSGARGLTYSGQRAEYWTNDLRSGAL